jgi:hypothetical protein
MNKEQFVLILKFTLAVVVLSFMLDKVVFYSLNAVSDNVKTGQSIGKLNQYLDVKDSLDVCLYGSSKVNHNIDPSVFNQRSFNMGLNRRSIACASALIKLLPKDKPQLVLLQLDYLDIFSQEYSGEDVLALTPKYHRDKIIHNEINKARPNSVLRDFFWSQDYNGFISSIIKNVISPNYDYTTFTGYDPIYLNEAQKNVSKQALAKSYDTNCEDLLVVNERYWIYILEIVDFCEENNKELIIFSAPTFSDHCKNDNVTVDSLLNEINVSFVDFSDCFTENNRIDYWKDHGHLTAEGADVFSLIFRNEIIEVQSSSVTK